MITVISFVRIFYVTKYKKIIQHEHFCSYAAYIVAGNSEKGLLLLGLLPDTQYMLTVSAIFRSRKYRSRAIIFRTLGEVEGEIICFQKKIL